MSAKEILAELPLLSPEERAELVRALRDLANVGELAASTNPPATHRELPQAGLHEGAWTVADDFDAPLELNGNAPSKVAELPQWGLHEGAWEVAEDFDDPLPDEFWLGEDA